MLFFHTLGQTWSHSTRLQTTESHTHVSFPQRRTDTDAARVRRGLRQTLLYFFWAPPSRPQAAPVFLFFIFSFGKSKFVKSQKSRAAPSTASPVGTRTQMSLHDSSLTFCSDRPALLCGDPLPELASTSHLLANPHLGSGVLGLHFCLVLDISQSVCVCVCA